jgi:hypothetical protein
MKIDAGTGGRGAGGPRSTPSCHTRVRDTSPWSPTFCGVRNHRWNRLSPRKAVAVAINDQVTGYSTVSPGSTIVNVRYCAKQTLRQNIEFS